MEFGSEFDEIVMKLSIMVVDLHWNCDWVYFKFEKWYQCYYNHL